MSSKSRSQKSKKKSSPPEASHHGQTAVVDEPGHGGHAESEEEVIHVPTGTSPLRFILMVVLVVFLTAIFAINPGTCSQATRGSAETYISWNEPGLGLVELTGEEFTSEKRRLHGLLRLFRNGIPTNDETARFLVLAGLAKGAGITVTDNELRDRLREIAASPMFQDAKALTNYMVGSTGGVLGFQETLRKQLRGERYLQLVSSLATQVSPADVERIWRENHQEFAFDYVGLEVAGLTEDARAEEPDDEVLGTWLADLSDFKRRGFEAPERLRAELIGFRIDGEAEALGLLAMYPDPAGEDHEEDMGGQTGTEGQEEAGETEAETEGAEDHADSGEESVEHDGHDHLGGMAKRYYDRVYFFRFVRPEPEEDAAPRALTDRYMSFEEVESLAEAEAPIYFALERWLADLHSRELDGTAIDMAEEASALGLDYRSAEEALSMTEWTDLEGWGGLSVGARIAQLGAGEFSSVLWVERGSIFVARLEEKIEGYMPELPDIRDEVSEAWIEDRAGVLAVERLAALRDGFEPLEQTEEDETEELEDGEEPVVPLPNASESEFSEAVVALGLEVARRPYMEQQAAYTQDPDSENPAHAFIRFQISLTDAKAGELIEPGLNNDQTFAYLVRAVGSRDPEAWRLSPGDLEQSRQRASYDARFNFLDANFGEESLFKTVGLKMANDDEQ